MAKDSMETLWSDAAKRYAEVSGLKFEDLPRPRSTEDLIQSVTDQNRQYEKFREKQARRTLKSIYHITIVKLCGN